MASGAVYNYSVFINCPFDARYARLFRAIVFSVLDSGFIPRCALEITDSSVERLSKILDLIGQCRLGIHDISRTNLDARTRLPRFNMPLELGMFLAAKHFGEAEQRQKVCIILDRDRYRYQKFLSDIAGKDIHAHSNRIASVIRIVRNWLSTHQKALTPGARVMFEKYTTFTRQLPKQCESMGPRSEELTFMDYKLLAEEWLDKYDAEAA